MPRFKRLRMPTQEEDIELFLRTPCDDDWADAARARLPTLALAGQCELVADECNGGMRGFRLSSRAV